MARVTRVGIALLVLAVATPPATGADDDLTKVLTTGSWWREEGVVMMYRYTFTFAKNGTFRYDVQDDVATAPVRGKWNLVTEAGVTRLMLIPEKGGKIALPNDVTLRYEPTKDELAVSWKAADGDRDKVLRHRRPK